MKYINDRHAEEHVARFVALTKDLTVEGIDISTAMRLPFFADCLASNRYKRYTGPRLKIMSLLAGFEFEQTDENTDLVYIQEGKSQREYEQTLPIYQWFDDHNLVLAKFRRKPFSSKVNALAKSISLHSLKSQDRKNIVEVARNLQTDFELSDAFPQWFLYQIRRFVIRYYSARQVFERTRPRAALMIGEYTMNTRPSALAAQDVGARVRMIQHGFLGQSWLYDPMKSDGIFLWGEVDKQWFLDRGIDEKRLILTGCMRAFRIENHFRKQMREKYGISDSSPTAVFFAPNLDSMYHYRANKFLTSAYDNVQWFIRPHPIAHDEAVRNFYPQMRLMPGSVPLEEALAVADLAVHDFSSMQFAVYAGIETACLTLDSPYPDYYPSLLGEQHVIEEQEQLGTVLAGLKPGYDLEPSYTVAMFNHGAYSVNAICETHMEYTK